MALHSSPNDLALALHSDLVARGADAPALDVLQDLLQTMYGVSLRTEEGEPITFQVCFIDPEDPDPDPPPRIRRYRWRSFPFAEHIPFSDADLTKLAKASDPRTSALAVFADDGGLFVWGLIDQGNLYHEYVNREADHVQAFRPGVFQVNIERPAHLRAWVDLERVAELRGTRLAGSEVDALSSGPLLAALMPGVDRFRAEVGTEVPHLTPNDNALALAWLAGLARVLLRAQSYGHGGALLIAPSQSTGLSVKYQLDYTRLREALVFSSARLADRDADWHAIHDLLDEQEEMIPASLHLSHAVALHDLDDAEIELRSIVWFVSLLTRVDGLVLLSPDLEVCGFGVEIMVREEPSSVMLAEDPAAQTLTPIDPKSFGTRHRSMMRYCAAHPGSVGFVISQDGDVRAMTLVDDHLVMWDQLMLQAYQIPQAPDEEQEEDRK